MQSLALHRELLLLDDIQEMCNISVGLAYRAMHSEAASIFLFSKQGILTRLAHVGVGEQLDESYPPGAGIVGRCVTASVNTLYGQIQRAQFQELDTSDALIPLYSNILASPTDIVCLPLNGPNRTYGVLRCVGRADGLGRVTGFTDNDIATLSVFAHQLAISISSLRRKRELDVNSSITSLLANDIHALQVPQHVATALVSDWSDFAACSIRLAAADGSLPLAHFATAKGVRAYLHGEGKHPSNGGFAKRALATREPVIVKESQLHLTEFFSPDWIAANGFQTCGVFPILLPDTNIGVLSVYLLFAYDFAPTGIRFIESVCRQLASAIFLARQVDARQQMIDRMNQIISPSLSTAEVLRRILESACALTGGSQGYIALTSKRDDLLHPTAATPQLELRDIPLIDVRTPGTTALAARTRNVVRCTDTSSVEWRDVYVDFKGPSANQVVAELAAPLLIDESLLGVIAIQSRHPNSFPEASSALLDTFARYASVVLDRDRVHEATNMLANLRFSHTNRKEVYRAIRDAATTLADGDITLLGLVEQGTGQLAVVSGDPDHASFAMEPILRPLHGMPLSWAALEYSKIYPIPDLSLSTFPGPTALQTYDLRSAIVVPLAISGTTTTSANVLGAILVFYRRPLELGRATVPLLRALAVCAAYALHDLTLIEERDRAYTLASVTARLRTAQEVSSTIRKILSEPLRQLDSAFRNFDATARELPIASPILSEAVALLKSASTGLSQELSVIQTNSDVFEPFGRLASDLALDAARLLAEGVLKDMQPPPIHVTVEDLWSNVQGALVRITEVLRLKLGAAYLSNYRNYSALELVACVPNNAAQKGVALKSFNEFFELCQTTMVRLPNSGSLFDWFSPPSHFQSENAVLFGRELIGGHLLIIAFGYDNARAPNESEFITLHEVVTKELCRYIDSCMFGIELDYLTSETGHLLGRAIAKVEAGLNSLGPLLTKRHQSKDDRSEFQLAERAIRDGVSRLALIRQNFYAFSGVRRGLDLLPQDVRPPDGNFAEQFDVVEMLGSMRPFFTAAALAREKKDTRFRYVSLAGVVSGSPYLLRTVFLNLFDNAVKFSYSNTFIEVEVDVSSDCCRVSFQNLGLGVAPDEHRAVFQPLRRSRFRDPARRIEGLGLGLSYCRRVIEEIFHGSIELDSRPADTPNARRFEGDNWLTTVWIQLPLAKENS